MKIKNKTDNKITTLITIYIYRIMLDLCYFKVIVPNYNYYGFNDYRTFFAFFISWVVLIFFSFPMARVIHEKKTSFSNVIVFVLSIITIVPFTTLIYSGMLNYRFIILNSIYWGTIFVLYFYARKITIKSKIIKFGDKIINDRFAMIFGIFSLLFVLYLSYRYTRFRFNFNLLNVYELRSEARSYNFPMIFQYLFPWTRVLNILFLAYSLKNKKKILTVIFFVVQMLSFGIDGLKATFFMPFIVIIIFKFYKDDNFAYYKKLSLYGITLLLLFGILEFMILKSSNIINIVIRRVLILPSYLNSCYVDFFSFNTPDYFRASFLKFFGFSSSYNNLGNIIGQYYFNRISMNGNNGLISDAVTNFGTLGVIFMPILLIWILHFMDKCTCGLDDKIYFALAIYFAIILSNSFLITSLITHGLLVVSIVSMMIGSKEVLNNENE